MRFFGRGLVATTTMIVFMGLRRLHNIGFAGGGVLLRWSVDAHKAMALYTARDVISLLLL